VNSDELKESMDAVLHPEWMQQTLDDSPHPDNTKCQKHRSIWISDVHLGTKGAKAEYLSDFLKHNDCETLYLVGDIIDGDAFDGVVCNQKWLAMVGMATVATG